MLLLLPGVSPVVTNRRRKVAPALRPEGLSDQSWGTVCEDTTVRVKVAESVAGVGASSLAVTRMVRAPASAAAGVPLRVRPLRRSQPGSGEPSDWSTA